MTSTVTNCLNCQVRPTVTRNLCTKCYHELRRNGELDLIPTVPFMDNPDLYINWAFAHFPELVKDIAIDYGFEVSKP